jgi:hypothetical protein
MKRGVCLSVVLLCGGLISLGSITTANAAFVGFDDFTPADHGSPLPSDYENLTWIFFDQPNVTPWQIMYQDYLDTFPAADSGEYYIKGTMDSGDEANRTKINFSSTVGPVAVNSISFRQKADNGAWASDLILQANLSDGSVLQETIYFNTTGWASFDNLFGGRSDIDALVFINEGGTDSQFFIDSLDYTPAVPIPGAVWLLGSGIVGLAGTRIHRKKK